MKEIKTIISELKKASKEGIRSAMASVVNVHGSSYRRTGARMLILENGSWFGSVSGGCLEGDVIENAKRVMDLGKPELIRYDTRQNAENSFGMGYGCNGLLEILLEPISYSEKDQSFQFLDVLSKNSDYQGLSTVFYSDEKDVQVGGRLHSEGMNNIDNSELQKQVLSDLQEAIEQKDSKSKTYKIEGKKVKVFYEVFKPNVNILIYGAVFHVVPFLHIATELGYNVYVTDSFEPIQPIWNFPNADEIKLLNGDEVNQLIESTPNLAIVFLTHNFFYIKEELPKVLKSNAPYVGILGSRRKTEKILREAEVNDANYSAEELAKIHYPIGLDIGADTPEEIALSIVAEIKAFFANRSGESLKMFDGHIHKMNLESM